MAGQYEQFFNEADTDKSGFLTQAELTEVLRKKGYKDPESKIQAMFRSCDSSGDNKVSLDEFLTAMGVIAPKDHKKATMRNVFREFDVNGDGTISREELGQALQQSGLSDAEVDRVLQLADADGSHTISYEEFIEKVFNEHE